MSRKDHRRAIAIALPPVVLARLRARQNNSRGRRLMDTLRVAVQQALAAPSPLCVPCPPAAAGTGIHLLQLPRDLRGRLAAFSRERGIPDTVAICGLVLGLDVLAPAAPPDGADPDAAQRRTM